MATMGLPLVTVAGPPGVRQLSLWHSLGYMTARLGRGGHLCGGGSPSRHLLFTVDIIYQRLYLVLISSTNQHQRINITHYEGELVDSFETVKL